MSALPGKTKVPPILLSACLLFAFLLASVAISRADDRAQKSLACSACRGLIDQMKGPNDEPYFLQSFGAANSDSHLHPTLENTAFTYDNAVAAIALYACGRPTEARRIADALVRAVETDRYYKDGRLRNAYRSGVPVRDRAIELPGYWSNPENRWIEDGYQVGSHTGSTAWGALALLTAYDETGEQAFLHSAQRIMKWINTNTADVVEPGYFGGFFGHEPKPERLSWKSTEQNTDVYAANIWLAKINPLGGWRNQADSAERFLTSMWDKGEGRFFIGTVTDSSKPNFTSSGIDALLWPLIAVPSLTERSADVIAWTETNHGVPGGFDFNSDRDGVWLEGTAQAALVYRLLSDKTKAETLFSTIADQVASNNLVYATDKDQITTGLEVGPGSTPGDFKYYRLPHVGATAWAALAALDWNPFVGRSAAVPTDDVRICHEKP